MTTETKATHTPGPWRAGETPASTTDRSIGIFTAQPGDEPMEICTVWNDEDHEVSDEQAEADARLIAAAPDLLAACELIALRLEVEQRERGDGSPFLGAAILPQLRAAIAKAHGS